MRGPGGWRDAALVALAVVLAFLPGAFGSFVAWDDDRNFLFNPAFRGLSWLQIKWMFTTAHLGPYAPLTWLTLAVDHAVWGMKPLGYHLTSLAWHAANSVLMLWIAARLLPLALGAATPAAALRLGAGAVALLFAVHPLRVESVVWITERRDVVSGFFYLAAVLAYLRFADPAVTGPRRRRWYGATLALFAAGILAKSIAVTLPAVLLVLDVYPLRRLGGPIGWTGPAARRIYLEKLPLLALAAAGSAAAFVALAPQGNMPSWQDFGAAPRLAVSAFGLAFYLWKTAWPVGLSPLYELPVRVDALARPFLLSGAMVVIATAIALAARRRWPALAAAWIAYAVSLVPVLGVFQNGPQIAADRYSYLACLGWALLGGAAVAWCAAGWLAGARGRAHALGLAGATVALVVLVGLTARQSVVWHDSISLWSHALAVDPASARAHAGLAVALVRDGQVKEAVPHLQRAVELNPSLPEGLIGLAVTLSLVGRAEEALAYAREAVMRNPKDPTRWGVLGEVLRQRGRLLEAAAAFQAASRLDPRSPANHYDLAATLAALGRDGDARAALAEGRRASARIHRSDPDADRAEALVVARSDPARAIAAWERYLTAIGAEPDPSLATLERMVQGVAALEELRAKVRPAISR